MSVFNLKDHYALDGIEYSELRRRLGGKAAHLYIMGTKLKLNVPAAIVITTSECRKYMEYKGSGKVAFAKQMAGASINALDNAGIWANETLVSVRSGAQFSMPGMMDTILNLGLNDYRVKHLAEETNPEFAYNSYMRFIQMYGETVLGVERVAFEHLTKPAEAFFAGEKLPLDVTKLLIEKFKEIVAEFGGIPEAFSVQLQAAIKAVWDSWMSPRAIAYRKVEGIPDHIGTAVTIQKMVFGNKNDKSGTGVVFSRDPNTGENIMFGDFLVNAQGEDVVAGTHKTLPITHLAQKFPDAFLELSKNLTVLENHFKDMVDVEFTIQDDQLWILQTRSGKRGVKANVRIMLEMHKQNLVDAETATGKIMESLTVNPIQRAVAAEDEDDLVLVGKGLAASDGVAIGKAVFSSDDAVTEAAFGPVILITQETSPNDVEGISLSQGILTMVGGLVSHAAVVARGWNKPCVVSLGGTVKNESLMLADGKVINKGDLVKINGETGEVYA